MRGLGQHDIRRRGRERERERRRGRHVFCAFFGFQVLFGIIKVKKLDERERLVTRTA
ncbi:hypothetical protein I3843_12G109700 [Carya illinoinensis]|nr:hypothetical protein I3843_12G109700 [Carya illinoinensis]